LNQPLFADGEPLSNTAPLTKHGDIAGELVDGVDRFLMDKLADSRNQRDQVWSANLSDPQKRDATLKLRRQRLAKMLGVVDQRTEHVTVEYQTTVGDSGKIGAADTFDVYAVKWPVLTDPDPLREQPVLFAEGLLLKPKLGKQTIAYAVALPDSANSPEQISGLAPGVPPQCQFAKSLAELGCTVLVPTLIDREMVQRNGRSTLSNREFLYRPAFELGRHLIGYEIQSVMSAIDFFEQDSQSASKPIITVGYGDGGMIALYTSALDDRISGTMVSGYFAPRESIWQQPLDRNVFGLLTEFGDAELGAMIAPRKLWIDCSAGPELSLPGLGGAPAQLTKLAIEQVKPEIDRCRKLLAQSSEFANCLQVSSEDAEQSLTESYCTPEHIAALMGLVEATPSKAWTPQPVRIIGNVDSKVRMRECIDQIDLYTQLTLREAVYRRDAFMKPLYDAAQTADLATYHSKANEYRTVFANEVIGQFDDKLLPINPRTRLTYDEPKWRGYEVVLDVWPNVIAYGILLLPKDIEPNEQRPVVVCQHGLEGRPQDIIKGDKAAYHDFAAKLAERGFITFAPQNLYIFEDRFRVLQRKANPLGKTLFSIIVPQHQQIVNWLKELPMVDPNRIAFYGLSYGGKSAMRIPALVPDYCLSICSADFNEWVDKNASTRSPYSYVWSKEYEIFEFGLGDRFNYAEMAALIAPRPFMVERGHHDGVASDETVAHEFARVQYHYEARLKQPVCEIEWFDGPHTINGQGTYRFLHRHLNWPAPDDSETN
jgi:dienelactone hydrolase